MRGSGRFPLKNRPSPWEDDLKVQNLSTTLLQGWPVCPARAWDDYSRRLAEGDLEGTEPTRFGSVVHVVCEQFHELLMQGAPLPSPLDLFDSHWRASGASDLEYFLLGRSNIEAFLDRTLYERPGATIGVEVRFLLDVDNGQIWLREQADAAHVRAIFKQGHVPVLSTIDRIDMVEPGSYEVYDYKTNAVPFTRWEVDNSIQLGVYDMAVRAIYPDAKEVVCIYDLLRWGRQPTKFDEEQRQHIRAYLIDMWHQISRMEAPEQKLNKWCRYCRLRGNCAVYGDALQQDISPVDRVGTEAGTEAHHGELFEEIERLRHREKIIKARIDEIEDMFAVEFTMNGGRPLSLLDGGELYLSPNPRYEFEPKVVWDLLKRRDALVLFMESATISKTKLERALKGRGIIRDEVMATMQKRYVKSTLRKRRIGTSMAEEEQTDV